MLKFIATAILALSATAPAFAAGASHITKYRPSLQNKALPERRL
jgi:hypothetical protein